jgi:maltokinase
MNDAEITSGGAPVGFLDGKHGRLELSGGGTLTAIVRDTAGRTRAAVAGDGFAADVVDAIESGSVASLSVDSGHLEVVLAAGARGSAPSFQPQSAVSPVSSAERESAFAVDMTNWSVAVTRGPGESALVVKFVSDWSSAERAATQLERLSSGTHDIVPTFYGRLDWVHPSLGRSTIALASELLPGATDGWTWAVDDVLDFVAGGEEPHWPAVIGGLAAVMHARLAEFAEDSTPQPCGKQLRTRAEAALAEALRVTHGDAGTRLQNRVDALRAAIASIPDTPHSGVFDLHGDLHVGQILRSGNGNDPGSYRIIDFDGDPQLDLTERARPDHPARDLAHLLTSISLVAAVAMKRLGESSVTVLDWAAIAKTQLHESYRNALAGVGAAHLIDEDLLDGFMAEQFLRELIYANRFLPRWQYAPDAGITFGYPAHFDKNATTTNSQEPPWTPPAFTTT